MPKNILTVEIKGDVPEQHIGIVTSHIVARAFKDFDFSVSYLPGSTQLQIGYDDADISFIEQFGEEPRRAHP
jgi:hypothetical protein